VDPSKEMTELFDLCLNKNIDLSTLSNFYILHTVERVAKKKESARKLGITFNGLKKRLIKIGRWNDQSSPQGRAA
jgi:hypothetical protein